MNIINSYENNLNIPRVIDDIITFHDIRIDLNAIFFIATSLWSFCIVNAKQFVVFAVCSSNFIISFEFCSKLFSFSIISIVVSSDKISHPL